MLEFNTKRSTMEPAAASECSTGKGSAQDGSSTSRDYWL